MLILGAIVASGCRRQVQDQPPPKPNVPFILLDDLRWDALGYAGHPHVVTPQIDRIANEGVNLRNAFATTSLCSPSRASLLSGTYAHKHGATNNFTELPAGLATFPKLLNQAGYATAKNDAAERTNLINAPEAAAVLARMKGELGRVMAAAGLTPEADRMPIDAGIKKELPDQKIR